MGGPGSGGARNGGNKSNAARAKEAAKNDNTQGKLSSFFRVATTTTHPTNVMEDHAKDLAGFVVVQEQAVVDNQQPPNHNSKPPSKAPITLVAHSAEDKECFEEKRKEAVKILHKVMNEGCIEKAVVDDDEDEEDDYGDDDKDHDEKDDDPDAGNDNEEQGQCDGTSRATASGCNTTQYIPRPGSPLAE
jgi:hypothetical protein